MKFVVALSATVVCEPLDAFVPVQPPEAVQLVALLAVHCRLAVPPALMVVGLAVSDTVGVAPTTETVTVLVDVPPVPVQERA